METKNEMRVCRGGKVACPSDNNGTPSWSDVEKMSAQEILQLVFSKVEIAECDKVEVE